ncbi:hypothetical protein HDU83_000404 [Entophlyctis luteolus]|nr:hypothetical protein HDU83_000404 [Entophlyctis luteolus]
MAVEVVNWKTNTDFYHSGMLRIYFGVFIAFLNAAINGYDNSIFNNMATFNSFGIAFTGVPDFQASSSMYSLTAAMIQIGEMAGCFFVAFFADNFGRRGAMQIGSVIIIAGVVLELATHNLNVFIVGRFLIGFGVSQVTTSAPTYTLEVAHPQFRAWATGIYNTGWGVGSIPAGIILLAMSYVDTGDAAWQIPVGVQAVYSGIVLIGCFFMPESPRWLMSKGREEDARKFLVHFHGNDKEDHPIVDRTLNEIREALEDERRQNASSYAALFIGRPMLYRLGMLIAIGFFSQYAGNWLAGGFTVITNKAFGFNTPQQQLGLSIVNSVLGFISAQVGAAYCERIGRRPLLIYGTLSYIICWTLVIICLAIFNGSNQTLTGVGILGWIIEQLFGIFYAFSWTSINALYPVEILPYSARAKGMALCQFFINLSGVIQSYVLIYGLNAWDWKFFTFYLFFNIFALVIIYYFFVETRGYSLEKIEEIFNAPNPVKKSIEDVRVNVEAAKIYSTEEKA